MSIISRVQEAVRVKPPVNKSGRDYSIGFKDGLGDASVREFISMELGLIEKVIAMREGHRNKSEFTFKVVYEPLFDICSQSINIYSKKEVPQVYKGIRDEFVREFRERLDENYNKIRGILGIPSKP